MTATPRFFVSPPLSAGSEIALPGEVLRHVRARRLRAGADVVLFDGRGGEYHGVLHPRGRHQISAHLTTHVPREAEPPHPLLLLQAILPGDRMDFAVQKAVELGATRIVPVLTERTVARLSAERGARRQTHWQRVAISACEQCGRNRVPDVAPPIPLSAAWREAERLTGVVLAPGGDTALDTLSATGQGFAVLVGPEGGLSDGEMAAAARQGFFRLRLGPRILRAETAGVAALAALQTAFGDLSQ